MAMFNVLAGDSVVLVWRQSEGSLSSTGTARPERRFYVLADGVFVWGRRRPTAGGGGGGFQAAWARNINSIIGAGAPR